MQEKKKNKKTTTPLLPSPGFLKLFSSQPVCASQVGTEECEPKPPALSLPIKVMVVLSLYVLQQPSCVTAVITRVRKK